jgi:hypothetical protein
LCYEADIKKAHEIEHEYFLKLVGDLTLVKNDLEKIKKVVDKFNWFLV